MNALTLKAVVTMIGLTLMSGTAPVWAQSPADPHHQPAAAPAAAPDAVQAPHDGGTMPMMDMCRQMMAGPMPGMGRDQMAHMLEMRGEMMKAMGEVMMKHGKMMMQGDAPK